MPTEAAPAYKTGRVTAQPQQTAAPAAEPTTQAKRIVSLDAFRGFTMFWIVGGSALMLGFQELGQNPVINTIVHQLQHSDWQGLRFYDLIWPSFMLMTGVSLPFSYTKRAQTQTHRQITLRVFRRAAVLFLLGSLRESVHLGSPYLIELSSALQPIAIAYFAAFLLVRKSAGFQAAAAGLILVGYALLLAFVPAPGVTAGSYERAANLVVVVDQAVLGRSHAEGWGTVLSTIPTIATTILGLLIGRLLMSNRSTRNKIGILAAVGLGGVALGWAMSPFIPVIMKLWTASYGVLSAGWACLMFLTFYWLIDARRQRWAFALVVIGMNSVAIYMAGTLVPLKKIVGIFTVGAAAEMGSFGALFQAVAVLAVEWLILYWMYRRKIFLTA